MGRVGGIRITLTMKIWCLIVNTYMVCQMYKIDEFYLIRIIYQRYVY